MSKVKISKRMIDALEAEGLTLTRHEEPDGVYYEGEFYTGPDYEKCLIIDLRGEHPRTVGEADDLAADELYNIWQSFDIDGEVTMYLNAGLQGTPSASALLEDMREQENRLERFSEVARAVSNSAPIPPDKNRKPMDERNIDDEVFYVIANHGAYWRTLDGYHNGAIDTCWGDIETADRFDTAEAAQKCINANPDEGKAYVRRVEVSKNIKIYCAA